MISPSLGSTAGKTVFFHVGAPKTGSTFLQQVMWQNRKNLAKRGIAYPLERPGEHLRVVKDLRQRKGDPQAVGMWDTVAERIRSRTEPTAVFSDERLGGCTPAQIERAVQSVQPAEVHVVFTARDLARQLASDWQEELKHRHTVTFRRFVDDLIELGPDAPAPFGEMFWGLHDPVAILNKWSVAVPPERIHVVTIPQPGGPAGVLWTRFAGLLGLDPDCVDTRRVRGNPSLGAVEASALRSLNEALAGDLSQDAYTRFVKQRLAQNFLVSRPDPIRIVLPEDQHAWSITRSHELVAGLDKAGYHVVGDLNELIPPPAPQSDGCSVPETLPAEQRFDVTVEALAVVLRSVDADAQRATGNVEQPRRSEELPAQARPHPLKSWLLGLSARNRVARRVHLGWSATRRGLSRVPRAWRARLSRRATG